MRTRYLKAVVPVPESPPNSGLLVLKDAVSNRKLGAGKRVIMKGRYRGMPLYSLTLEERATCWDGCQNWDVCYGDNMPFGKRYQHGPELEGAVTHDVTVLASRNPYGFVVRLHVLGDFYSVPYVQTWDQLLEAHYALRLFGYTHWRHDHPIGKEVARLVQKYPDRVAFRRSDRTSQHDPLPPAMTVGPKQKAVPGTVLCPEQTQQTTSCLTCGLCMNNTTGITFIDHSRKALRVLPQAA